MTQTQQPTGDTTMYRNVEVEMNAILEDVIENGRAESQSELENEFAFAAPDLEANARLIAAAPELLNMLQRMTDECNPQHITPDGITASAPCLLTLEHARAAIAAATGAGE